MDQESLTPLSSILSRTLRARFHEWEPYIEAVEAESGNNEQYLDFRIPAPNDETHFLSIRERGDCIEVCFSDGRPPGGAERLLICEPGEERQCVNAALEFIVKIIEEKVVVARESSSLVRGRTLPPSFMNAKELPSKKGLVNVVSWRGTHDMEINR
jgi:hypothetical protein